VRNRSIRMLAICLMTSLTLGCAGQPLIQVGPSNPAPPVVNNIVASSCGWEEQFYPDPGFETRWTRSEKEWLAAHNQKVAEFCPQSPVPVK
jgi:hypothetical protein